MRFLTLFLIILSISISSPLRAQEADSLDLDDFHIFMFDLIDQLNIGEYEEFISAINFERIAETALLDVPLSETDKRSFKEGLIIGSRREFETAYTRMFDISEQIEYINYAESEDYYSILVRFSGEAGLNYVEFELEKDSEGNISIVDYYPFITGEFVSTTINRTVKIIYSEQSFFDKILDGLSEKEKEFTTSLPKLVTIRNYTQNELYEEARREYEDLPMSVQNNKLFLITMMGAAQMLDDEFYLSITDRFEKFYPTDPSFPLIILDSYLLRGKIQEAQEQIDILDEAIGGDNYLNIVRGNIALIGEDSVSARTYYNTAIENNIYSEDAYWSLITLDLADKEYDLVVKNLNRLIFLYGYEFAEADFSNDPYIDFSKSEEFKEWVTTL